jgi:serine/threonine protein phosphatase PrpC
MGRIITFNVTCLGASHVKSAKPCQDYSLSWHSEDNATQVAIVCDGHGGDTYVRSDRGSEFAAKIALQNIQNAIAYTSPELFLDKEGAVTARPEEEDDIFHSRPNKKPEVLSDDDKYSISAQQENQNRQFYEAVEPIRKQDQWMQELFARIYVQWMAAINKDAEENPFNDWEKGKLKGAPVAKAYGTTLIAFVRTQLYWFAFHIGDGKLLCCDSKFQWREPVPWDFNCFLNYTTSLCGSEPIHSFRYAFNGKGEFPIAVIMGSDGMDDSWCTMENLQNFYSQILCVFNELKEEKTIEELSDYLPRLSEKGSRDDMSVAGIVDMDAIDNGAAIYKSQRESRSLYNESRERKESITKLEQEAEAFRKERMELQTRLSDEKHKKDSWIDLLFMQEKEIDSINQKIQQNEAEVNEAERKIADAQKAYDEWSIEAETKVKEMEANQNVSLKLCRLYEAKELEEWEHNKEIYLKECEANHQRILSEKVANMMIYNDEAAKNIQEAKFEVEESEVKSEDTINTQNEY